MAYYSVLAVTPTTEESDGNDAQWQPQQKIEKETEKVRLGDFGEED